LPFFFCWFGYKVKAKTLAELKQFGNRFFASVLRPAIENAVSGPKIGAFNELQRAERMPDKNFGDARIFPAAGLCWHWKLDQGNPGLTRA
jgi:hypothetical protein